MFASSNVALYILFCILGGFVLNVHPFLLIAVPVFGVPSFLTLLQQLSLLLLFHPLVLTSFFMTHGGLGVVLNI